MTKKYVMILPKKSRWFFRKKSNDFSIVFIDCKNINTAVMRLLMFYILNFYFIMFENELLNSEFSAGRVINLEWVEAVFMQTDDNSCDVSLNINSQRFLVRFTDDCGSISDFEVISFKGYILYLTNSLIIALRNLVEILRSKL